MKKGEIRQGNKILDANEMTAFANPAAISGLSATGPSRDILGVTSLATLAEEKCNGILTF